MAKFIFSVEQQYEFVIKYKNILPDYTTHLQILNNYMNKNLYYINKYCISDRNIDINEHNAIYCGGFYIVDANAAAILKLIYE